MTHIEKYSYYSNQRINEKIRELNTDITPVISKTGRILKGENPFIDTVNGAIIPMDLVLNKEEFNKVIELWKNGQKEDAANILKAFGIRERHMQFNLAFSLMMSALCLGSGACLSKLVRTRQVDYVTDYIETKDYLPPIQSKDAILKTLQQLGDNLDITDGTNEFINATAPKQELFDLFDKMADAKGISTDEFIRKMFDITHQGNQQMIDTEIEYLNNCLENDSIKTVGDIFKNTDGIDMTGVKGFNPFGIKNPEAAQELTDWLNDTQIVTGTEEVTREVITDVVQKVPGNDIARAATAGALASEPYMGGVRGTSREDRVNAKYKELLNKWKEEQLRNQKNTNPGEGTRKRLRREAEEMVKENKNIMSFKNFSNVLS